MALRMNDSLSPFWSAAADHVLHDLESTPAGLTEAEARRRLAAYGPNLLRRQRRTDALTLLLSQFSSPIILILLFAAALSLVLQDATDSLIIMAIVLVSGLLGFWQERGAAIAVEKLLVIVSVNATVLRDGQPREVAVEEVVPGDVVQLSAGDTIPGDCLILESKDLFADEAALTGETFPQEKEPGVLPAGTPLSQRTNALFMGTHVVSGMATAVVVRTGRSTEFGKVSERLRLRPPETEFEHGVRHFGYFLVEVTLLLVIAIFAINVYLARPVLDSFLFALALAVGLTPQLLPAIISVNLAHGAQRMAAQKVIVKRLASIENFGSMNVLCSDKTGTLTEGTVRLHSALDLDGNASERVLLYAHLNATFETGFSNPLDEAICAAGQSDLSGYKKLDEVPYDFVRKRLSVLVAKDGGSLLVTKGALGNVLDVCSQAETPPGALVHIGTVRTQIEGLFAKLSGEGYRVLGIAYRADELGPLISKADEAQMVFLGFLVFFDPPKSGVAGTIQRLNALGVSLRIITGDNPLVARSVAEQVGLPAERVFTGADLLQLSDEALVQQIGAVRVFAGVEPNQKERIIVGLRKAGNVIGYMGDGINDASALHAADVGISVDTAVDVAKEAADIVLLEKDLEVLLNGVREGRMTFANTLKYVFMATSANFGNMFSMAGASLFLSFLPLLPKQILLTNLLTDLPETAIASDSVDPELVQEPRRWDVGFIRSFMLVFGPLSSVFDFLTFGVLLLLLNSSPDQFRTGWFVESVISASAIVLVVRTRRPFFRSRPSRYLTLATILVAVVVLLLPFTPLAEVFGFTPLPPVFYGAMAVIVGLYALGAEMAKRFFYYRAVRLRAARSAPRR